MKKIMVWDLPTRLFHWLLVVLLCFSFVTALIEEFQNTDLHMYSGYGILALILFRVSWGFVGGTYSRFSQFLKGPGACLRYIQLLFAVDNPNRLDNYTGHNPLGGWMIVAMLVVISVQIVTGLFSNDDILYEGPLAYKVSEAMSSRLTVLHKQNYYLLGVLIFLHLCAISYYTLFKQQALAHSMISGFKWVTEKTLSETASRLPSATRWWLVMLLALGSALIVYAIVTWV
jgi:cytochrome b